MLAEEVSYELLLILNYYYIRWRSNIVLQRHDFHWIRVQHSKMLSWIIQALYLYLKRRKNLHRFNITGETIKINKPKSKIAITQLQPEFFSSPLFFLYQGDCSMEDARILWKICWKNSSLWLCKGMRWCFLFSNRLYSTRCKLEGIPSCISLVSIKGKLDKTWKHWNFLYQTPPES